MKKPGHHETRVTRGFVGSLVRSRLADFLNIRLLLMDAIRRFAGRRQSPRLSREEPMFSFLFHSTFAQMVAPEKQSSSKI